MSSRIENYALIGDMHSAALVERGGSIDWLCLPRFDSGAVFAKLLGTDENGHWELAPEAAADGAQPERRYRDDTLVLETTWRTSTGEVRVIDFMPPRDQVPNVVRIVEGISGTVAMRSVLRLRFGYGQTVPWVRHLDGRIASVAGPDSVWLSSDVPHRGKDFSSVAEFEVNAGDRVCFDLTWHPSYEESPAPLVPLTALAETEAFWRDWASRCTYTGPYRDAVVRSLITLKALIYQPTGGIVAAVTTSLPEEIGGVRNWDYRYCWLRDATMTLQSLVNSGYLDEAEKWRLWLLRAIAGSPEDLQIMYGVAGERRLAEWEADWLPGYEGSQPVRIGNAASEQLQLDVYGEVLTALDLARRSGLPGMEEAWSLQRRLLDYLADAWRQPDEGLWEIRGERRHFTHSKVMVWAAFDAGVRAVESGMSGPAEEWRELRDEVHAEVLARAYDAERNTFTQSYDHPELDAATLLIPHTGFLPPDDERVRGTVDAIIAELSSDGFVRRYNTEEDPTGGKPVDGLPGAEGTFLICSFWLADALHGLGRVDEATELFERLVALRNDVGLLAEEYDPTAGRLLGNVPQAFSHVGLVNTALLLGVSAAPAASPLQRPA